MKNHMYIKVLFFWCISMPLLKAQANYCLDTLFFCKYGTTVIEGDGQLVGPFHLSTSFFSEIDYDFDGENLSINISSSFFSYPLDSMKVEDLGNGTSCQVPFFLENIAIDLFDIPEIGCVQYNYQDPSIDYNYTISQAMKYNYCIGDRVTYILQHEAYPSYSPSPSNHILTPERISQTLGDIENIDSFSIDLTYNTTGYELLELTTYNSSGCAFSAYYPVEVLDTLPTKIYYQDSTDMPSTVCQGQQIDLRSQDGKELHWEVSNGLIFNDSQISFTLDIPGTYQIKVVENSYCDCSRPAYYTITVEEAIAPSIICTGTLCDGGEVTYYTDQECDNYIWSIENGIIIGGGGSDDDFVTILWSDASAGSITLGTPSCSSSICSEITIKEISIIDAEAPIIGLDSICTGDVSYYSVPDYNGTVFSWTVSEGGYILDGQYENNVSIKWDVGTVRSTAIVSVRYENCDINCQGYSEKEVAIRPVFSIVLNQNEYCINSEIVLTNNLGDKVNYSIITPFGDTLVYDNVDTVIISPDTTGVFGFIAYDNQDGICNNDDQTSTKVSLYPQPIIQLNGPEAICKLQTVSYSVDLSSTNETVLWEVFDGDLSIPLYSSTSLDFDYKWVSDGPYQITATVFNTISKCSSEAVTFTFHSDHEIKGIDSTCLNTSNWYAYNGKPVASNKWIITPDSAGIILGVSENKVNILWQTPGNHNLSIEQCDKSTQLNVYIEPEVILTHDAPDNLCYYDSVLVSFYSDIPVEFDVIRQWHNDTVATNDAPASYLLPGATYHMYSTTANGCKESKYIYINSINKPNARIKVDGKTKWCPPGSTRLEARFFFNSNSYQWFKDGIPLAGQTGRFLNTNQFGSYTLQVTNQVGCVALSDAVLLEECCDNESAPFNDYSVDLEETVVTCNERMFEVLPTYYSSNFVWRAKKNSSLYYMGVGTEVTYTFLSAGTYTIYATGDTLCQDIDVKVCGIPQPIEVCEGGKITVTIPVVANFNTSQTCGSKKVKFNDTSSKISGISGLTYQWSFGEPNSGSENTSTLINPSHTYDSLGIYSVQLIITHPSGCTTTKIKSVNVRDKPKVGIETNQVYCLDSYVRFYSIIENGSGFDYSWNFGDPDSGTSNTTSFTNPYHEFSGAGTFDVKLRVKDPNNCVDNETITVTIVENDLSGEINSDKIYPKCPEEEVTLTAPSALYYHWNNGDSVQNIQVVTEGNYRVTISNEHGCRHVTNNHFVDDYVFQPVDVFARIYSNNGASSIHYDSIVLCYGDQFNIEASYIPLSKYTWTNSSNDSNVLTYEEELSNLTPGRYEYFTKVKEIPRAYKIQIALLNAGYDLGPNGADGTLNVDTKQALDKFQTDNGLPLGYLDDATLVALGIYPCEVDSGPFVVIIKALPEVPKVDSDLDTNCEGELSTMFVSNINEDQNYEWSTGVEGVEITAYAAGKYQVITTDLLGCISSSEAIEIYDVPEVSAWMTGCREVCFPEEICIDLHPEYTYTLIKDGVEGIILDISSGNLAIEGIGDYQLKATNSDGCSKTSDLLVLTKTPDDHKLSGIVYYDTNETNDYDLGDVLLEAVPVHLLSADSIISETVTNLEGYYEFVGFENYDLQTVIDPSTVDYILKGSVDSVVIYETCIEEKGVDFPLTDNCQQIPMHIEQKICTGKTIIIDDIEYGENDTDTLVYHKAINCDSTVYLEILPYPIPEISLSVVATCVGEQLGRLDINLINGDSLLFSIDENLEMYSDTVIQNLSKGMHTLYIHTIEGCIYPQEFEILEMLVPTLDFETISTCVGLAEGQATLSVSAVDSVYYTIDQGASFTNQLIYDSLSAGSYELWAIDSLGCVYEAPFEVVNFEEPLFDLVYMNSCIGENNGSISLTLSNNVETEFKLFLDSLWLQDLSFEDLEPGLYKLYSKSEFGCIDSTDFVINLIPEPLIDFTITEECDAHSLGIIEVISDTTLLFSLNGEGFASEAVFDSLEAGHYTIYIQDEHLCKYEFFADIPIIPSPNISFNPTTTCLDESMGIIEIQDQSSNEFLYSMDDSVYTKNVIYDELSAGNYGLFVQNEIGCTYFYEFEIEDTQPPTVSLNQDDSCPNDDTGVLEVSTSGDSDLIYINDGVASHERLFDNLQPGIYEVWVEDTLGCKTYSEIEVFEMSPLLVEMPLLDSDCYKDEVMILPRVDSYEGTLNYTWTDGSIADYFVATKPGQYSVTISDDCDIVSRSSDLIVRHTATNDHLYSSNIFSPNNDGANDCFKVMLDSDLELIDFWYVIFDRWGNKMFTTTSTFNCWDGKYKGIPVEQGVYVVMSEATVLECDGIKKIRKVSDVTVIR